MTYLEAFKSFDIDFDGKVSKKDLTKALQAFLGIKAEEVTALRVDRLLELMSDSNEEHLQPSDFRRVLVDRASSSRQPNDWKDQALKKIAAEIVQKYGSIEQSFKAAARGATKVDLKNFRSFVQMHSKSLNLSDKLIKELFQEVDAEDKLFLSLHDWQDAFDKKITKREVFVVDFVDHVISVFADASSVFNFYMTYVTSFEPKDDLRQSAGVVTFEVFAEATKSLLSSFTPSNLRMLFEIICKGHSIKLHNDVVFGKNQLKSFLRDAKFTGSIRNVQR